MSTSTVFDRLEQTASQGGVAEVLEALTEELRSRKEHHQLFEALKMQVRHRLGLPVIYRDESDELSDTQRNDLEEGLIEACREVGLALLSEGKIREGWMYMRAVGDKESAAQAIAGVKAHDDNTDELVEVLLHEGVDPARGFSLVLNHYGTCNAITTFESVVLHQRTRQEQRTAAELLVRHLHEELLASVRADIAQQEGAEPPASSPAGALAGLVADRPWLFQEHSYHIDTTHLAATVRAARLLTDPDLLRLGFDLTEYGRRLHSQFQYPSDEPFAETYPSHALYLQALLGENVDEAIAYFRDKAQSINVEDYGTIAIETYVDLLARIGRPAEALRDMLSLMPDGAPPLGIAPSLIELANQAGDYDEFIQHCRTRQDLLGFATALAHRHDR